MMSTNASEKNGKIENMVEVARWVFLDHFRENREHGKGIRKGCNIYARV